MAAVVLPNAPKIVVERDPVIELDAHPDGSVTCKRHENKMWCRDIKKMYVNNEDSQRLWYELQLMKHDSGWDQYQLPIPVSVEENVWATVFITFVSAKPELFQVNVLNPETSEQEQAGYLFEGDGRNALRLLVYNWFLPKLINVEQHRMVVLRCNASSHGPSEHRLMNARLTDESKMFAEQWRLYFVGRCTACEKKLAAVGNFVPDA